MALNHQGILLGVLMPSEAYDSVRIQTGRMTCLGGNRDMPCEQWFELVGQYRRAAKQIGEAADELRGAPGPEFDKAWQRMEIAWKTCDDYRAELLDHEHRHSCLDASRAAAEAPSRKPALSDRTGRYAIR